MSRLARSIFVAVALFAAAALPAQSQEMGSIIGLIRVARGEFPSDRIMVTLQGRGAPISTTYANGEGRFSFGGLPTNPYHVVINDSRYMPVDEMVIVNPTVTPQVFVQITLVLRQPEKTTDTAAAAGTNPYIVNPTALSKNYPKQATKEFERGVKSDKEGREDDAIRHYEKAITMAPDFYPARNNLGSDYLKKSDVERARQQFQEAARLNPNDAQAYFNMANLLLLTKQPGAAVQQAREGLNRQPNSAFGQFVLGSALDTAGKTAEAESALHRAIEVDASMSKAHLALVNIYLRSNRKVNAIAELKAFLASSPHDPLAPKASELLKKLDVPDAAQAK